MNPSIVTVNNNLNINRKEKTEIESDLRYFFMIRESNDPNRIVFSVMLKNNHHSIINRIWFSAFIGIGGTKFASGLDEQASFHIKNSNLGGAQYLSGYTKDEIKLPPETPMEILYFDIPKDKLSNEGSLEFYFGCESVKKISFIAFWGKDEIKDKLKEINVENFLNFLKYKNHKTCFESIRLFVKRSFKNLKRFLKRAKNWFVKDANL